MKRLVCTLLSVMLVFCTSIQAFASTDSVLNISNSVTHDVAKTLYGISLDDSSFAIDGGLGANMVSNNSFEYYANAENCWGIYGGSAVVSTDHPISQSNPTYEAITVDGSAVLKNNGYVQLLDKYGYDEGLAKTPDMHFAEGETYDFSCYLKSVDFDGSISVYLDTSSSTSKVKLSTNAVGTQGWKQVKAKIKSKTDDVGALAIEFKGSGTICIDYVTLVAENSYGYGEDTWKYSSLRSDLVDVIKNLKPAFVRFLGGCNSESDGQDNLTSWKDTIGSLEQRKQTANIYDNSAVGYCYNNSNQIGYHEYFQLCRELNAEPVPVVGAGIICQSNSDYSRHLDAVQALNMTDEQLEEYLINEKQIAKSKVADEIAAIKSLGIKSQSDFDQYMAGISLEPGTDEFKNYVQDILDLIEYANGDENTSYWGALRSANGSPQPFDMKYIQVGNDGYGEAYNRNFEAIRKAIKKQYPSITVISSSESERDGKTMAGVNVQKDASLLLEDVHMFDGFDRASAGAVVGQLTVITDFGKGISKNNVFKCVCESAFMIGAERNSDAVKMVSITPMLSKLGNESLDEAMVMVDGDGAYPTPSYYTQMLFANNTGKACVDATLVSDNDIYQNVTIDEQAKTLYIKLVNASGKKDRISVNLNGFEDITVVSAQGIDAEYKTAFNSGKKQVVAPVDTNIEFDANTFDVDLAPYSVKVVRVAYGENTGKGFYQLPEGINLETKAYVPTSVKVFLLLVLLLFVVGTGIGYFAYVKLVLKRKGNGGKKNG